MTDADFFWREIIEKKVSLKTDKQLKLIMDADEFKRYVKSNYLQGKARPNDTKGGSAEAEDYFWNHVKSSKQLGSYLQQNKARNVARLEYAFKKESGKLKTGKTFLRAGIGIFYSKNDDELDRPVSYYVYNTKKGKKVFRDSKTGRFAHPKYKQGAIVYKGQY